MAGTPALPRALLGTAMLAVVATCAPGGAAGSGGSAPTGPAGSVSPSAGPSPTVLIIDGKKVTSRGS
jgi:hypothetical protein